MKKTGELLRQARESKGLSVHEIGLSLKINSKVLTAIEAGETEKLPAKTFLRGFVQSYANYLKLNTDEILALFTEEMGTTRPQPSVSIPGETVASPDPTASTVEVLPKVAPTVEVPRRRQTDSVEGIEALDKSNRLKTLLFSTISVFLVVLLFTTKKIIDRYQKEAIPAEIEVNSPLPSNGNVPEDSPEGLTTPENGDGSLAAAGVLPVTKSGPEENASVISPQTPVASSLPTEMQDAVAATPSTPSVAVAVTAPSQPATPAPPPVVVTPPPAPATPSVAVEKNQPKKSEGKPVELIVEALDDVQIEYSSLKGARQTIRLNAEQVHTIRSRSGLKISVSNGGAVNFILNGRDLGAPGDLGKPFSHVY